jgi:MFS family permease
MDSISEKYVTTTWACYIGCLTQGIAMNFAPLLFIPLKEQFGLSYTMLGTLVMVNFFSQVLADLVFGRPVDRYGFRPFIIIGLLFCTIGLVLFSVMPTLFPGRAYMWLLISTVVFSLATGLLEVLLSPIINAIPSPNPGVAMVRLHSFYAWGMSLTVIVTALGLYVFGSQNWHYVVLLWALLPFANLIMFARSPLPEKVSESSLMKAGKLLTSRIFIVGFLTIFFGAAAELTLVSWLSSFLEKGLGLTKLAGDLLGLGGFAISLGVARTLYGAFGKKISVNNIMIIGAGVAFLCYLLIAWTDVPWLSILACCIAGFATSMLWPGTLAVTSAKIPTAGVLIFALLAAGGDIGTSLFSWLTGVITDFFAAHAPVLSSTAEQYGLRMGLLISSVYPLLAFIFAYLLKKQKTLK